MCSVTSVLRDMTFVLGHDTPLGKLTTIVRNIQIQNGSSALWPGQGLLICGQFDLGGMTLVQEYDTPLGHGQQLYELLSKSNITVESYGLEKDHRYVCNLTLVQGHDTSLGHGQQLCGIIQIQNDSRKLCPGKIKCRR